MTNTTDPTGIYDDGATYGPDPDADITVDHEAGGIYDDGMPEATR